MSGRIVTRWGAAVAVLALAPGTLAAHDGHALAPSWRGVAHWFASPVHLGAVGVVVVVGVALAATAVLWERSRGPARGGRTRAA